MPTEIRFSGRLDGAGRSLRPEIWWGTGRLGLLHTKVGLTKGMRKNAFESSFLDAPAYPRTGSELMRALKQGIERTELGAGQHLAQQEFGRLLGAPRATVNDWFQKRLLTSLERFMCALERLDLKELDGFLRQFRRPCPRLSSPMLVHDDAFQRTAAAMIAKKQGLTVISGGREERRFVLTALGHAVRSAKKVGGIDLEPADRLVPVCGVKYGAVEGAPTAADLHSAWSQIQRCRATTLLFNGVWSAWPESRRKIILLSRKRHVVAADSFGPELEEVLKLFGEAAFELQVNRVKSQAAWQVVSRLLPCKPTART